MRYPVRLGMEATLIMRRLLRRSVSNRLGASAKDAAEVKEQLFFKCIDFDDLLQRKIKPPFVPKIVCLWPILVVSIVCVLLLSVDSLKFC